MTPPKPPPALWSPRRWVWLIVAGTAGHAALVFWLAERPQPPSSNLDRAFAVALSPESRGPGDPLDRAALSDPTVFALPHPRAFSGGAWLRSEPFLSASHHWEEPPDWLPLNLEDLGRTFSRYLATNSTGAQRAPDSFPARPLAEILLLTETPVTQSVLRIEGPLTHRRLLARPDLPEPVYTDVVLPTVVQVSVNRDGLTESAILVSSSQLKSLDEQALALARGTVFGALPAGIQPAPRGLGQTWSSSGTRSRPRPPTRWRPSSERSRRHATELIIFGYLVILLGALLVVSVYFEQRRKRFDLARARTASSAVTGVATFIPMTRMWSVRAAPSAATPTRPLSSKAPAPRLRTGGASPARLPNQDGLSWPSSPRPRRAGRPRAGRRD